MGRRTRRPWRGVDRGAQLRKSSVGRAHSRSLSEDLKEPLTRPPVGLPDADGLKVGVGQAGMRDQAGRRPARGLQLLLETDPEMEVGELRLTVCAPGSVAADEMGVSGIDGAADEVRAAGDRHDSRPGGNQERG